MIMPAQCRYEMRGEARHDWEHSVPEGKGKRISLTFRSMAIAARYTKNTWQLNSIYYGDYCPVDAEGSRCGRLFDGSMFIQQHCRHLNVLGILVTTFTYSKHSLLEYIKAAGNVPLHVMYGHEIGSSGEEMERVRSELDNLAKDPQILSTSEMSCRFIGDAKSGPMESLSVVSRGVFHPKMTLIFCQEGLAVAVGTSNITGSVSVEGTWTDFFPIKHDSNGNRESLDKNVDRYNDFGKQLANFVFQCEAQQHNHSKDSIGKFFAKYLPLMKNGIIDIEESYDFSQVAVRLVATVPGRFWQSDEAAKNPNVPSSTGCSCFNQLAQVSEPPNGIRYGMQRVQEVLEEQHQSSTGVNSIAIVDKKEDSNDEQPMICKIYAHQTSFGGSVDQSYITGEVLPCLLGSDYSKIVKENQNDDVDQETINAWSP